MKIGRIKHLSRHHDVETVFRSHPHERSFSNTVAAQDSEIRIRTPAVSPMASSAVEDPENPDKPEVEQPDHPVGPVASQTRYISPQSWDQSYRYIDPQSRDQQGSSIASLCDQLRDVPCTETPQNDFHLPFQPKIFPLKDFTTATAPSHAFAIQIHSLGIKGTVL